MGNGLLVSKWERKCGTFFQKWKRDGIYTKWYPNGQKWSERTYTDGNTVGLGTIWYETGQKMEEGIYEDGGKDSLWTFWFVNGNEEVGKNLQGWESTRKDDFMV
jgi:antitoxin component YwqK of YwqJK toxin-antitoxin module